MTPKRVTYITESLVKNHITSGGRFLKCYRDGRLELVRDQEIAFTLVRNVLRKAQRKAYIAGEGVMVTSVLLEFFGSEQSKRKASDDSGEPDEWHARSKTMPESNDSIYDGTHTSQHLEHQNVARPVKCVAGGHQQVRIVSDEPQLHLPGGQNTKEGSLHQLKSTVPSTWMTAQPLQDMTVSWQQTRPLQQQVEQLYYMNQVPPYNMLLPSTSQLHHKEQMVTSVDHLNNQAEEQYQYVDPSPSISSYTQQMLSEVTAKSREIDLEYGGCIEKSSPQLRGIHLNREVNLQGQLEPVPKGKKELSQNELVVLQRQKIMTLQSQLGKLQQKQKQIKIKRVTKIAVPGQLKQRFIEKQLSNGRDHIVDCRKSQTIAVAVKDLTDQHPAAYRAYNKNENQFSKPSPDFAIQQGCIPKAPNVVVAMNESPQYNVAPMYREESPHMTMQEEFTTREHATTSEAPIAAPGWNNDYQGNTDIFTAQILSRIKSNAPRIPLDQTHGMNKVKAKDIAKKLKFAKKLKLHKSMLSSGSSIKTTDSQPVSDADMNDFSKWEFIPWADPINPNYPCVTCEWTLTLIPLDGQASDPIHLAPGSIGMSFN